MAECGCVEFHPLPLTDGNKAWHVGVITMETKHYCDQELTWSRNWQTLNSVVFFNYDYFGRVNKHFVNQLEKRKSISSNDLIGWLPLVQRWRYQGCCWAVLFYRLSRLLTFYWLQKAENMIASCRYVKFWLLFFFN